MKAAMLVPLLSACVNPMAGGRRPARAPRRLLVYLRLFSGGGSVEPLDNRFGPRRSR